MKGFSHVDLAVAVAIIVLIVGFILAYSSEFFLTSISLVKIVEIKNVAVGLSESIFNGLGIPEDWQWEENVIKPSLGNYIYRVPVFLKVYNGTDNNNVMIWIYLNTNENAYNTTFVAYDGDEKIPLEIKNYVDNDGDGFLEEVNLSFQISLAANENKTIFIYYSKDNETQASYSSVTETNNTFNITLFSPERILGLTVSKLNAFSKINKRKLRENFGVDKPFKVKIVSENEEWEFGYNLTNTEVAVEKKVLLFQNSTGDIKLDD